MVINHWLNIVDSLTEWMLVLKWINSKGKSKIILKQNIKSTHTTIKGLLAIYFLCDLVITWKTKKYIPFKPNASLSMISLNKPITNIKRYGNFCGWKIDQ